MKKPEKAGERKLMQWKKCFSYKRKPTLSLWSITKDTDDPVNQSKLE